MADEKVMLGHGSGGSMMKRIIDEVFFAAYGSDELLVGDDAAVLPALEPGERLAYSTDSFVVTPHFFPGGDIGPRWSTVATARVSTSTRAAWARCRLTGTSAARRFAPATWCS